MAKTPKKTETVPALLLDPESSVALTLSHAWHYTFDTEKATDAERTWIGPFATREEAEKGLDKALAAAITRATEIKLLGGK
jgi:hypothetical protein